MHQNKPNPFNQNTIIEYEIPVNAVKGQLLIFDMQGTQLKKYDNLVKGKNSITINGNELGAGMFLYSLILDGNEVDTKRMILIN